MTLTRLLASILLVSCLSAACSADGGDSEQYDGKDTAVRPQLAQEDNSEQYYGKDSAVRPQLPGADDFEQYYGKAYSVVRLQLVQSGYELARIEHDKPPLSCPGEGPCEPFPEMIFCSGTGLARCFFGFRNKADGFCIKVTTSGETRMTVSKIVAANEWDREKIGNCK